MAHPVAIHPRSRARNGGPTTSTKCIKRMSLLPLQIASAVSAGPAVLRTATSAVSAATSTFGSLLRQAVATGTPGADDENAPSQNARADYSALINAPRNVQQADTLSLRTHLAEQFDQFRIQLMQLLDESGVDTTKGFTLELDERKQLKVAGEHPDKRVIETVLAANPEFAEAFGQLGALHTALERLDDGLPPQQDGTGAASGVDGTEIKRFRLHLDRMAAQPAAA